MDMPGNAYRLRYCEVDMSLFFQVCVDLSHIHDGVNENFQEMTGALEVPTSSEA